MPGFDYRPHLSTKDGEMLGVRLVELTNTVRLGEETEIRFELVYDQVDYGNLKAGVKFKILEGTHLVGEGQVK